MKTKTYNRYYLHRKLKGVGIVKARQKLVLVPYGTDVNNKYLTALYRQYKYLIQIEIPC